MTYNKNTRFGYIDIRYNEGLDKLFLLYSGICKYNPENIRGEFGDIIYVFNRMGIPVEKLELDKPIFQFGVSDDGSAIYGLSDTEILKFEYRHPVDKAVTSSGSPELQSRNRGSETAFSWPRR
ncbi:MAG: hypothetical protein SCM96_02790 [Acidobacteriota bacterium]|nr:hypothetical protein [Acidobacteriota bacterium]